MSMSKEAVKDKMKDQNVIVLNVLPEAEYTKLHITGSKSIPLGTSTESFAQEVEKQFGKNHFIITYCASVTCDSAPKAAKALLEKGFKAADYAGGIKEWSEVGYPTGGTDAMVAVAAAPAIAVVK